MSHSIILESLPANRNMFNLIFCILESLLFFSIIERKSLFLNSPCSTKGFAPPCFSLSISSNELHMGSLAVAAFGFYSVLNTFPFMF